MAKPVVIQTLDLDADGHPTQPSGRYYRVDSFAAFNYTHTPPGHDANHRGHVIVTGIRNGAAHEEDREVLLFYENGVVTNEDARVIFHEALRKMGFEIWETFPI